MLRYRHYLKSSVTSIGVHYCLAAAPHRCKIINVSWATPFHSTNVSKSRMLSGTRLLTHWPITSQMCSIGFKSGVRDGHGSTFIRLAWRRALVARAVCEGAPLCIIRILPLFCRWGMQTGVRIPQGIQVTPYHHTLCFYHFLRLSKLHLE